MLPENPNLAIDYQGITMETIYLAGGCFWGVQAFIARVAGVAETCCGYANGHVEAPSYEQVCRKDTGHAETVRVHFDPNRVSIIALLSAFFDIIDPTSMNKQGGDEGSQYRTGIYYTTPGQQQVAQAALSAMQRRSKQPIVVELLPLICFYEAEEYHQDYLEKNPNGYCHVDLGRLPQARPHKPQDADLRQRLTPLQYEVTQHQATEQPFTGTYDDFYEQGLYVDIVSGEPLFTSREKFNAGCGWPAFSKPVNELTEIEDSSHHRKRTEVRSRRGDSHLGHVFNDGPQELGGLRYCINSAALRFIPLDRMEQEGYGEYLKCFEV